MVQPKYYYCEVITDDVVSLRKMGAAGQISADHFMARGNKARMVLNDRDIAVLHKKGLKVEVLYDALEQAARVRKEKLHLTPVSEDDGLVRGFVDQYLDTGGIYGRFLALHNAFPAITEWSDLPYATSGYDGSQASLAGPSAVKLFRINTTPGVASKPGILLMSGTHAREWVPPIAMVEFAEELLRNYAPGSTSPAVQGINNIVEGLDIFIVPAVNPDGINFSFHDYAMWRKNRRTNPAPPAPCPPSAHDKNGVDNNRNYSIYWGGGGSSGDVCNDSYRGPAAFSEPENRNILHLVEQYPNIITAVDCHSFGEDIFRPQPTGGAYISSEPVEPHDHAIFLSLEAAMNAAISSATPGKTYATGTTNNHAGTSDDYLFLARRIYAFDLECAQAFQPSIADGLTAVREVAAALIALSDRTLSLAGQLVFPVNIAQVIDRSGSMVAYGYVDQTRSNARRMVDLASLNDSMSIVSFNEAAALHVPLTKITSPDRYSAMRNAVDAIVFGGWTSIGAGLQAAGLQLQGAVGPKAIILLSDGYQNRTPWAADVLPTLPAGTKVHTIALGPHSDQALMETIAAATGGEYYFSPGELELHEIYNYVLADAADEELALNETVALHGPPGEAKTFQAVVDEGAAYAIFTVSWNDPNVDLSLELQAPHGPIMDLGRVRRLEGRTHSILKLRRPQAGTWTLGVRRVSGNGAVSCTVAAFLHSDIRLELLPAIKTAIAGRPISVKARVKDSALEFLRSGGSATVSSPCASLKTLTDGSVGPLPVVGEEWLKARDALPGPVLQALAVRNDIRNKTKQDPLRYISRPCTLKMVSPVSVTGNAHIENAAGPDKLMADGGGLHIRDDGSTVIEYYDTHIQGTYNLKVRVKGRAEKTGSYFVRTGMRSVRVI